jgi:hypothetical protein
MDVMRELPEVEAQRNGEMGEWRVSPSLGGPSGKPYAVVRRDGTVVGWHATRDDAVFAIRSAMRGGQIGEQPSGVTDDLPSGVPDGTPDPANGPGGKIPLDRETAPYTTPTTQIW